MLGRMGGYEVSGVVGSGGMGVVLKAVDRSLDRVVAIKVLAPHLAATGAARKRFAREAKAAAAVLHPNVIAIHSVANDESLPYLVMPYVRGTSLQKRIDDIGPLPLAEVLRISSQIAAGLAAAHAQGLVHRDIKPANILLEEGVERVAITDFGLARAVDDATLTCSGAIAGTPQYMSPEQARGEPVDCRSDLFSLGSVMYAMCTGRPPFRAETSYGVMRRITDNEPTPIREVNAEVPIWLCNVIEKLHAKNSGNRFSTAEEVADLLEDCLAHVQSPTTVSLPANVEQLHERQSLTQRSIREEARRSFYKFFRNGVLTMFVLISFIFIAVVGMNATAPPDIAGQWQSDEWGAIELRKLKPGEYSGEMGLVNNESADTEKIQCTLSLKWSRTERRFNGSWRENQDHFGKLSLRMVEDEIRGGWTTSNNAVRDEDHPRLGDFSWKRAAVVAKNPTPVTPTTSDDGDFVVTDKRLQSRIVEPRSWLSAIQSADDLREMSADEAWEFVSQTWPQLSTVNAKQQFLKAIAFSNTAYRHRAFDLGIKDPESKVREWAKNYANELTLFYISEYPEKYEQWYAVEKHHTADEAFAASIKILSAEIRTARQGGDDKQVRTLLRPLSRRNGVIGENSNLVAESVRSSGLAEELVDLVKERSEGVASTAAFSLAYIPVDEAFANEKIVPLLNDGPVSQFLAASTIIGRFKSDWAVDALLEALIRHRAAEPEILWSMVHGLAAQDNPRAIPTMIAVIDADNTYNTVYGVGHFGLGKLTGVPYDESHDGSWWRTWWEKNQGDYLLSEQDNVIPRL